MDINCSTCSGSRYSAEDGMICDIWNIEYLEDILNVGTMFCDKYYYNYCLDCDENILDYEDCIKKCGHD